MRKHGSSRWCRRSSSQPSPHSAPRKSHEIEHYVAVHGSWHAMCGAAEDATLAAQQLVETPEGLAEALAIAVGTARMEALASSAQQGGERPPARQPLLACGELASVARPHHECHGPIPWQPGGGRWETCEPQGPTPHPRVRLGPSPPARNASPGSRGTH